MSYDRASYLRNRDKRLAAMKANYLRNREKRLAQAKAYREANREKIRASRKKYRAANPEKTRERNQIGYEKHRLEILAAHKDPEYRAKRKAYRRTPEQKQKAREYARKYRQEHLEEMRERSRLQHRTAATKYLELLAEKTCSRCGFSDPRALCFHHRDPSEKEFNCSKARYRSWDAVLYEVAKCDCLCLNCHSIVHAELRDGINAQ